MQMADMDAWTTREAAGTDAGEPAYLLLDGVTKRYSGQQAAVDDLHLALPRGKLLGLLGPSGCGKTTTLRMIAGLLSVTSGHIRVSGDDISNKPPHQRDIGLVFQNYALFPHMSAAQNVAFGLEMRGVGKAEIQARVDEALEMVRLPGYGSRRPREMSGGQQQRVALARALVIRPRILLLDEPLSNLDAKLRDKMRLEIRDIQQRLGITTVFVTHDQVEALTMCDVVGVMAGGRLAGHAPGYLRAARHAVRRRFRRPHQRVGRPDRGGRRGAPGRGLYRCDTRGLRRGKAKIVIRPHRIHVTSDRDRSLVSVVTNSAHGSVRRVTYIGDVVQYGIDIGVAELKAEVHTASGGHTVAAGDKVLCEWKPQDMIVFEGCAP